MVPLPLLSIFVGMALVVLALEDVVVGWHPPFPKVAMVVNSGCAMKMKQCEERRGCCCSETELRELNNVMPTFLENKINVWPAHS